MIEEALENMDLDFTYVEKDDKKYIEGEAVTQINQEPIHVLLYFDTTYFEKRPESVKAIMLWKCMDEYYEEVEDDRGQYHKLWQHVFYE